MLKFFHALFNPLIPFFRYALFAGLLSSAPLGIIGSFVIVKRISYIAGAIAHSALGGIGLALFLQYKGLTWFSPILGAVIFALFSAFIIGIVSLRARQRQDTVIGIVWALGMSLGFLFLHYTPTYIDPMSYFWGDIQLISQTDLLIILGLDVVVISISLLFFNKFVAICFDEEFARLRGIRVQLYYLILLFLTAITVVLMVTIVGIVLVIALLTLPPAFAALFRHKLLAQIVISMISCVVFIIFGFGISITYNLPSGPAIIVCASIIYMLVLIIKRVFVK